MCSKCNNTGFVKEYARPGDIYKTRRVCDCKKNLPVPDLTNVIKEVKRLLKPSSVEKSSSSKSFKSFILFPFLFLFFFPLSCTSNKSWLKPKMEAKAYTFAVGFETDGVNVNFWANDGKITFPNSETVTIITATETGEEVLSFKVEEEKEINVYGVVTHFYKLSHGKEVYVLCFNRNNNASINATLYKNGVGKSYY